jgi:hypothetical protein
MSEPEDKERSIGLYQKYVVQRADGSSAPGGKHEACDYFVLDLVHDRLALVAVKAYADQCRYRFPLLHLDLIEMLARRKFMYCLGPKDRRERAIMEDAMTFCEEVAPVEMTSGIWLCHRHALDYEEDLTDNGRQMLQRLRERNV